MEVGCLSLGGIPIFSVGLRRIGCFVGLQEFPDFLWV